jgi:hypothetical protein
VSCAGTGMSSTMSGGGVLNERGRPMPSCGGCTYKRMGMVLAVGQRQVTIPAVACGTSG